jgi:hypothetical protein
MPGICAAVKATTSESGSSRNTVLKLWKSRPPAPMITSEDNTMAGVQQRRKCNHRGGDVVALEVDVGGGAARQQRVASERRDDEHASSIDGPTTR